VELNEAFASQSLVCIRELGLEMNKRNSRYGMAKENYWRKYSFTCRIAQYLPHMVQTSSSAGGFWSR